jgi:hypothetical protein
MRPALVLLAAILVTACGASSAESGASTAVTNATIAGEELTLDIPELL